MTTLIAIFVIFAVLYLVKMIERIISYNLITSNKEVSMYRCPKCGHGVEESFVQYVFLSPSHLFPWSKMTCESCGYRAVRFWAFWK